MTKEEIEQYIDLDNKIKNRIVQISHALHGVRSDSITAITPNVKQCFTYSVYDRDDFVKNSNNDPTLHLDMTCYNDNDDWECRVDKNVLCLTDEQIVEIVEYDRKVKEEEIKRQKEAEEFRRERLKKEVEEKEYKQYLRLKKKFEKE
jgi:hypothetical protein